jgi:hypothetical protein
MKREGRCVGKKMVKSTSLSLEKHTDGKYSIDIDMEILLQYP